MLKYYQEEKYFNLEQGVINNSLYNISKFPVCLNDIEILFQRKKVKLPNCELEAIPKVYTIKGNYDIITNSFSDIFSLDNNTISIFKEYYNSNIFPKLKTDCPNINSNSISIGSTLKPNNLKNDLDNYLIGYNNNEIGMMESLLINKRCYFSSKNSSNNYENYKINQVELDKTKEIANNDFVIAYIACFFRNNKNEISKN